MTITSKPLPRTKFHPNAYRFVFAALRHTQESMGRCETPDDDEGQHITGEELLEGIREFALDQFGMLAATVFRSWGLSGTEDFGRIVFELVDRGEMRKTERDQLSDFFEVYDFEQAFEQEYEVDTQQAFQH